MIIPDSITKMIQKKPTDNNYFYHADENMKRLSEIYEGKVSYISSDLSLLINTLEMYYKGYLQSKLDEGIGYKLPAGFLTENHDLFKLADEITDNFIPLFSKDTVGDINSAENFYRHLRHYYTAARYTEYPNYSEFKEVYEFVLAHKNLVINNLLDINPVKDNKDEMALDL